MSIYDAIIRVKSAFAIWEQGGNLVSYDSIHKACDMAVDALEKQIPMKTMPQELGISPRHPIIIPCGNCGMELEDRMWEYCPWCGQAIDCGVKND